MNNEKKISAKQAKKILIKNRLQTKKRVKKYREKKKELGYKTIAIDITPDNKIILDRYIAMGGAYNQSYSDVFNGLIKDILKRRNKAMFYSGVKWVK